MAHSYCDNVSNIEISSATFERDIETALQCGIFEIQIESPAIVLESSKEEEQQEQQSSDDSWFERTFSFVAPSHVSMNQIPRFVYQRFREIAEFHIYHLLRNGISGADMRSYSNNRICFRESSNTAICESAALLRKYIFFFRWRKVLIVTEHQKH